MEAVERRFWARVQVPDAELGCMRWMGTEDGKGYGKFFIKKENGKTRFRRAHIWIYERLEGEIPEGHHLHHLCGNRRCVNVMHLSPVTKYRHAKIHDLGKLLRGITHCKHGHEFTEKNTHAYVHDRKVVRYCRMCARIKARRWYALHRISIREYRPRHRKEV
jgi:hypothetical protein